MLNKIKELSESTSWENKDSEVKSEEYLNKCYCCCIDPNEDLIAEDDEENKLPQEVYQIISEVYDAHMEGKDITELVENYKFSVKEFCDKEELYEIIYFVKIFILKVIHVMKVSTINIYIICLLVY